MTLPEFGRDSSITHDKTGGRFGSQISQMMWCHVVSCHVIRIYVFCREQKQKAEADQTDRENLNPPKKET